jgi:thiosulfate/3-mercaptopyruvate sulfurtransferase
MKIMNKKVSIIYLTLLVVSISMQAQDLIKVDELVKNLKNPNLIVISGGTDTEYNKAHITGSILIDYTAFDKPGDIEGLLVSDAEMAKLIGDAGVSEKHSIVVYDEYDGRYAGRLYSLLKYLGAKDVKILDGGLEAWKKGRKPITRNPTNISKTTFNLSVNKSMMADIADVDGAQAKANLVLLDTRSPEEFNGTKDSKGHLPGAMNIEYKELLDANGMIKAKADLEKVYAAKGVGKDKQIVLYCSSGVRTGLHYLALVDILGYQNVKIYDGGYNEYVVKYPGKIVK